MTALEHRPTEVAEAVAGATVHRIRRMTAEDLPAVVGWHRAEFPAGFYAQLGEAFLRRWMAAHLRRPASVSLVALDGEHNLVGYLLGTTDDGEYGAGPVGLSVGLAARGAAALVARPALWADFAGVRARSYAGRAARAVRARRAGQHPTGEGELLYICVERQYRQRGGGAALLDAYVGEARRRGTERLHLVTEADNAVAQQFYLRRGWSALPEPRRSLDGRPLVRMELCLREPST
jgi:ribosomal protein S18 acetylase RimI-like enzyme